jgi:hypothetical protein
MLSANDHQVLAAPVESLTLSSAIAGVGSVDAAPQAPSTDERAGPSP